MKKGSAEGSFLPPIFHFSLVFFNFAIVILSEKQMAVKFLKNFDWIQRHGFYDQNSTNKKNPIKMFGANFEKKERRKIRQIKEC